MNSKVNDYFSKLELRKKELEKLRNLMLDCNLDEDLKWGEPCYSFHQSNIAIIGNLKEFAVLGFFKGVLLQDSEKLLHQPGEHTQSARLMRFKNLKEIVALEPVIKAYIFEAIEVERAGLKVKFKDTSEYVVPIEFQLKLDDSPELKQAFESLTPGRQKAYLLHFAAAKQSNTRTARIEKNIPNILQGKGLNEDFKKR